MTPVYLDHNATTPMRPEAVAAMVEASRVVGNASSTHGFGRAMRGRVDRARERVAELVGAKPGDVVFTAGGTEANNAVLRGAGRARVVVSAIEHDSARLAVEAREEIPVAADGRVDLASLDRMLSASDVPAIVSVMLANNETGVMQPVAEAARLARRAGALVHCDAVQAAGKTAIDVAALDVDFLTLSAHKLGGPQGVGAIVVRGISGFDPLTRGGGQERGRRAGTENVAGIAAFGAAIGALADDVDATARMSRLRDRLEAALRAVYPAVVVHGASAPRLANTSCVSMPGVAARTQSMALDLAGFAVGAGSACSSGKVSPSHVLAAMGVDADDAASAIRVSVGWTTTDVEIDRFVAAWREVFARLSPAARLAAAA
ncbi:MAG: cysteine desulfurase [Rhodospirillales bacterium]|nr:MAG: cysteine desulfurase [Rhodospirillales bacterium]